MNLTISPKKFFHALLVVIGALVLLHLTQAALFLYADFDYVGFLDLDIEQNLPTFYSSLAIEFCALLLFLIFVHERQQNSRERWRWLGLSLLFAFLGLDEATRLHENLSEWMESTVTATGLLHFPWVIPYTSALVILGIVYAPWFFRLPHETRKGFLVAGTVFIIGALGFEMLSARAYEESGSSSVSYTALYTIEETCEMLGIALFAKHLLSHMEMRFGDLTFRLGAPKGSRRG